MVQWWVVRRVVSRVSIGEQRGGNGMGISFMQWLGRRNQGEEKWHTFDYVTA